jgi:hypothetical protein
LIRQHDARKVVERALNKYRPDSRPDLTFTQLGWRCEFSKTEGYIACCVHDSKRIKVSIPHLNARSESEFEHTVLHEIAHAIVGPNHGHNDIWREKAKSIGCNQLSPCSASNVDAGRAVAEVEKKAPIPIVVEGNNVCPVCNAPAAIAKEKNKIHPVTGKKIVKVVLLCGHEVLKKELQNDPYMGIDGWTSHSGKIVFPYQVDGIKATGKAFGRILIADEPGLGKTIQALGALKFFKQMRPALWVCKRTLALQAIKEAADWCGPEFIAQIIEHPKMFIIPNLNLYIISMDLLRNMPSEKMEEIKFNTVIADEIQHFKDPDSSRTSELRALVKRAQYFIALSGTPWKNRGSEYYSVLNMLRSDIFKSYKHFKWEWVETYNDRKTGKLREGGIRNIPKFREVTKDFVIRRMRDDVLPDLPKIQRNLRFVDMEELYAESYSKAEGRLAALLKAAIIDGQPLKNIVAMLMQLKHITGLAKVQTCIEDAKEWLENVPEDYEKLTIFHHHIDVGDNLQHGNGNEFEGLDQWLVENGYNPTLRMFGGKSPEEREQIKIDFMKNPKNRVMIASTLASGEGLNLQFCQKAYMLERQWNPANEEQAELRFSRPLTRSELPEYLYPIADRKIHIDIPYFIAAGTVDEILTNMVEEKRLNYRKSMNAKDQFITWDEAELVHAVAEAIIKKRFKKQSAAMAGVN